MPVSFRFRATYRFVRRAIAKPLTTTKQRFHQRSTNYSRQPLGHCCCLFVTGTRAKSGVPQKLTRCNNACERYCALPFVPQKIESVDTDTSKSNTPFSMPHPQLCWHLLWFTHFPHPSVQVEISNEWVKQHQPCARSCQFLSGFVAPHTCHKSNPQATNNYIKTETS